MAATTAFRHKHLRIDQLKLDRARRILEAETETETARPRTGARRVGGPHRRRLFAGWAGKGKLKQVFA